jgi:hypothetical protein
MDMQGRFIVGAIVEGPGLFLVGLLVHELKEEGRLRTFFLIAPATAGLFLSWGLGGWYGLLAGVPLTAAAYGLVYLARRHPKEVFSYGLLLAALVSVGSACVFGYYLVFYVLSPTEVLGLVCILLLIFFVAVSLLLGLLQQPATGEGVTPPSYRRTHCFGCKRALNSRFHSLCPVCRWIRCPSCGACGCSYLGRRWL